MQAADTSGDTGGTTTLSAALVERWACEVLCEVGLTADEASATAAGLAFAEARAVRTHGFVRLGTYVDRIRAGGIKAAANPRVDVDLGALVIVDADDAIGMSSGVYCTDIAIDRARRHGVGMVAARRANHFGAAGFYVNRMADQNLVGIALCNTDRVMCAPFGGAKVLGTNPIAFATPLPPDERPQLDMATTHVASGKLIVAAQEGHEIPYGWAVDADGNPTTSASAGLEGALLPAGGPKGFGLAFMIDALVAVGGAEVSPDVAPLYGDPSAAQRLGHVFLAVRADAAGPLDQYRERIVGLVTAIHQSGPSALAPGEPELQCERTNAGRIELTPALLQSLDAIGTSSGVPFPASEDPSGS